ncbi:MAG: hypothetical protein K2N22_02820 [Clostridia bacterium]|nr:hypothetical protein [Clostridia bacterium]
MKKSLLCFCLLIVTSFFFAACGNRNDGSDNSAEKPAYEYSDYSEQELEYFVDNFDRNYEFVDNQLIVMLTEQASFKYIFYDYTAEDFKEIGAVHISELDGSTSQSDGLTYKIRQYLSKDPSGNNLPGHLKHYNRTFSITLDKKDKDNVLRAIFILKHRSDIFTAEPDFIGSFDV